MNDCVTTNVKGARSPRMYIVAAKRKSRGEGEGRWAGPAVKAGWGKAGLRRRTAGIAKRRRGMERGTGQKEWMLIHLHGRSAGRAVVICLDPLRERVFPGCGSRNSPLGRKGKLGASYTAEGGTARNQGYLRSAKRDQGERTRQPVFLAGISKMACAR